MFALKKFLIMYVIVSVVEQDLSLIQGPDRSGAVELEHLALQDRVDACDRLAAVLRISLTKKAATNTQEGHNIFYVVCCMRLV